MGVRESGGKWVSDDTGGGKAESDKEERVTAADRDKGCSCK